MVKVRGWGVEYMKKGALYFIPEGIFQYMTPAQTNFIFENYSMNQIEEIRSAERVLVNVKNKLKENGYIAGRERWEYEHILNKILSNECLLPLLIGIDDVLDSYVAHHLKKLRKIEKN